jgi:hypothetical protein
MASRGLTPTEQTEAQLVFGDGLAYARVRVAENAGWTNALPRLRGWFSGHALPAADNAVTLGLTAYFPRRLQTTLDFLTAGRFGDFAWLIHELCHAWQAERIGARYLTKAIAIHVRSKGNVYDYGGEPAVFAAIGAGTHLRAFNVEQQGEIARDYYLKRKQGVDASGWEPLVAEFRQR